MTKRNAATASKHAHSPKIVAQAQRSAQAIVRSPKDSRLGSVETGSGKSLPKRHSDSKQKAPLGENPVTVLQQEVPLVENPVTALQNDCKPTMTNNDAMKGFDLFSATAN